MLMEKTIKLLQIPIPVLGYTITVWQVILFLILASMIIDFLMDLFD